MRLFLFSKIYPAEKYFLLFLLMFCAGGVFAQKSKADSIRRLLIAGQKDTGQVYLMWQLADAVNIYNPDTALRIAQQAVYRAREIRYAEGESKSLGSMASAFIKIGNYPRALELYFQKLQVEEKRNRPISLASVLMNIGVVYTMQEEYNKALQYYNRANDVVQQNKIEDRKYYIFLNLGDVYDRLGISTEAFSYFNMSLKLARNQGNKDLIAAAMTGLGHSYLKMGNYQESLINYRGAIAGLTEMNDDELLCEATLGIAGLYELLNKKDSAAWYARYSGETAKKGGFLSHQLKAAEFLTKHYKGHKNIDKAFLYLNQVQALNDSINSKTRIRESQILSTNEQLRQLEIAENKKIAAKERRQQLQLLFIGIFIPGFFLLTLLLSRIKIHIRIIKVLGILSLLIFFEYLTLLLHPYVLEFTHHTPVYEILIFVSIAAILIPAHHRLEHWLIEHLTRNKDQLAGGIRLITKKIKLKGPSS